MEPILSAHAELQKRCQKLETRVKQEEFRFNGLSKALDEREAALIEAAEEVRRERESLREEIVRTGQREIEEREKRKREEEAKGIERER
jgi:hypothetical protein